MGNKSLPSWTCTPEDEHAIIREGRLENERANALEFIRKLKEMKNSNQRIISRSNEENVRDDSLETDYSQVDIEITLTREGSTYSIWDNGAIKIIEGLIYYSTKDVVFEYYYINKQLMFKTKDKPLDINEANLLTEVK